MKLKEINKEYENLKHTVACLEKAMEKFKGTNMVENYLSYNVLSTAKECVIVTIESFENKDWK